MNRIAILGIFLLGICVLAASGNGQESKLPSDADIAKMLVGKWRFEPGREDLPLKITMTYAKDQTCEIELESLQVRGVEKKGSGTWKVDKGDVVVTVKTSTDPKDVDKESRSKLVSIDASTFKMEVTITVDPGAPIKDFKEVLEFKKVK